MPDRTRFFAQHASIRPWLQMETAEPETEWRQTTQAFSHTDQALFTGE